MKSQKILSYLLKASVSVLLQKDKFVTLTVIGVVVLLALAYTGFVVHKAALERAANNPANNSLKTAEGVEPYTDMSGEMVSLSTEVGKVLVVNSWASWSPDSSKELPALAQLANKYQNQQVSVLAINRAEPRTTAERFLATVGASDGVRLILDPDDHFYKSIAGYAMPETIFYDKKGNVVHQQHGVMTPEEMEYYLLQALQQAGE